MIVYVRCRCKSKLQIQKLESEGAEVRNIKHNPEWAKQARQYGMKLPFIVRGGKARPIL